MKRSIVCAMVLCAPLATPLALYSDGVSAQGADTAAERARIANERIRRDLQARQRTDPESAEDSAPADARAQPSSSVPYAATQRPPAAPYYAPPASGATAEVGSVPAPPASGRGEAMLEGDYTRTLAQLRVLGELRDAGYLTDEEFTRIKTRIISSVF